jgi:hypothetical protein
MHSVLIVFQYPKDDDGDAKGKWLTLWQDKELPDLTTSGVERIAEKVWLIQLEIAMPAFCGLVARAEHWGVPYKTSFIQEELEWIYSREHPERGEIPVE